MEHLTCLTFSAEEAVWTVAMHWRGFFLAGIVPLQIGKAINKDLAILSGGHIDK